MKNKARILMILLGLTIALITAGVPVVKQLTAPRPSPCVYSENEVLFLMKMSSVSKAQAEEMLRLACEYAVTAHE